MLLLPPSSAKLFHASTLHPRSCGIPAHCCGWPNPPPSRSAAAAAVRSSQAPAAPHVGEEGELELPRSAGETPLSRLIGSLISFKPLFSVMKLGARQLVISNARKSNIPWREMTNEILNSDVYKEMESIQNRSIFSA